MNFKAWFKSKTADKVLQSLREEIITLININSSVIEIGCGTGDLLFKLSDKIERGLGVDIDRSMIEFAKKKKDKLSFANLEFEKRDFSKSELDFTKKYDISTSTLCLHEMDSENAIKTLKTMAKISSKIIIADYSKPKSFLGKISLEFDEFISGHYSKFRKYRQKGGINYLCKCSNLMIISQIKSSIDGIQIWILSNQK